MKLLNHLRALALAALLVVSCDVLAVSANGTTAVAPSWIVDDKGATWTIGSANQVLRNGSKKYSWTCKLLLWYSSALDCNSPTDKWYALNRDSGSVTLLPGDPRVAVPVPPPSTPTPPPTSTPPPPVPAPSDFEARKAAAGVVRWFDFDTTAQLGTIAAGANFGTFSNSGNAANLPVIDTAIKASGTGSLRFDIPSQSFPDAQWYANFSPDLSQRFGENSEFYVQWRQRFNQAFVDTVFLDPTGAQQGGIKQAIIGPGDTATTKWASCESIHVVTQTHYQSRFVIGYNSCTGSGTHGAYAGFETADADVKYQNGTAPYCLRSAWMASTPPSVPVGCVGWVANEWLTFQIHIKTGPRNNVTNDFDNSIYQLWIAREGQASVLVIDWKPGVTGYFPLAAGVLADDQRFGKLWLLPYMTNASALQVHALAQTWYDDVIISTQRIADPAVVAQQPAPTPTTGTYPAWRQGKAVGQFFEIAGTANMAGSSAYAGTIDAWNGFANSATTLYSILASGDGNFPNGAFAIDLLQDAPKWTTLNPGTRFTQTGAPLPDVAYPPFTGMGIAAQYYWDGLPTGRHTYYSTQLISAAHDKLGHDRVMAFGSNFPGGMYGATGPYSNLTVDGFDLSTNKYDPAGSWALLPALVDAASSGAIRSITKNPITEDIYISVAGALVKWMPKTDTYSGNLVGLGLFDYHQQPTTIDVKRNRLVAVYDWHVTNPGAAPQMQFVELATGKISTVTLTGTKLPDNFLQANVQHDVDSDRYLLMNFSDGVYAIDPTTGATTFLATVPTIPLYSTAGRFVCPEKIGGCAYLPRYTSNLLFMPTR